MERPQGGVHRSGRNPGNPAKPCSTVTCSLRETAYLQLTLSAIGKAKNVILSGANVTCPARTAAPLIAGNASPAPSFNSLPFNSALALQRAAVVSVYRSAPVGIAIVCVADLSKLIASNVTPPGFPRMHWANRCRLSAGDVPGSSTVVPISLRHSTAAQ